MRRGFSLVELSIVLVILGLLVGGILAGQSLVHASELRAVGAEYQRYSAAVYAFRDKYFGLPGDITNATLIWGKDTTSTAACAGSGGVAATPGTCNGGGDGVIGTGASSGVEGVRAWQQLALAGLIEGNYTGYYDTGPKLTIGLNVPASRLAPMGWAMMYRGTAASNTGIWNAPGNYLQMSSEGSGELWAYSIIPADAWNIDSKFDDGAMEVGRVLTGGNGNCDSPHTPYYSGVPAGRAYNLSYTSGACVMFFKL